MRAGGTGDPRAAVAASPPQRVERVGVARAVRSNVRLALVLPCLFYLQRAYILGEDVAPVPPRARHTLHFDEMQARGETLVFKTVPHADLDGEDVPNGG